MTTIQTHRVEGYGPYAYRVHGADHPEAGDNEQYWEYLGPAGRVDPDALDDDEVAELRSEGFGLARFRDNTTGELHLKTVANEFRDEATDRWGEGVLAPTDDRRMTEVELAEDAPRAAERLLGQEAADMQAEVDAGSGQAPLTDAERDAIDWSKDGQNVMHARTAKAALHDAGVSDWRALYSGDIESDGWDDVAERNRGSMGGERTDSEEQRAPSTSAAESRSKMEKRAVEGAREGSDEAVDALREYHGWTDSDFQEEFGEVPA